MSLKAMVWAWEQKLGSPAEMLVLLALADHTNQDNECWPTIQRLADRSRLGSSTVKRELRKLRDAGYVVVKPDQDSFGRDRPNRYFLNIEGVQGDTGRSPQRTAGGPQRSDASIIESVSEPVIEPGKSLVLTSEKKIGAKKAKQQKRATLLPDDFALTEDMKAYAVKNGVDPERVFYEFSKYWRRAERPMKDWGLVWENRVRALFGDPYYALRPTEVKREPLARGEPAVRRVLTDEELKQAEIKERNGGAI